MSLLTLWLQLDTSRLLRLASFGFLLHGPTGKSSARAVERVFSMRGACYDRLAQLDCVMRP
jgi:hypothetical protein